MKAFNHYCLSLLFLLTASLPACAWNNEPDKDHLTISAEVIWDKIYASWLGQMVGNIYGLPHENKYIREPGPDAFPYGYTHNLERLKEIGGAFSDDDTDIEYIYLLQMEKYGPEPTYALLAEAWKHHIRERVWLANRAALALMHFGYSPPYTGKKEFNPHWFQIDPQLVNEIWGITAPGMVKYGAEKSAWAARITNDDWGIEPTIHYGAMFSAAFFESDVNKLIDIGTAALPPGSRFARTVSDAQELYKRFPGDWQLARKEIAAKYYDNEPPETKTIWNANLNAACGILALLYGQGDFQKTLDLACAMGFDADNQAATMSGLLGVAGGTKIIPEELLYPVPGWKLPFNDLYKNVSRHDMPDTGIREMTDKTFRQAKAIVVAQGGKVFHENGKEYFSINTNAAYIPPLEFGYEPLPPLEAGKAIDVPLPLSGSMGKIKCAVTDGLLPPGVRLINGRLQGIPEKPGVYPATIEVDTGNSTLKRKFRFVVTGRNFALDATEIISNVRTTNVAARDSMWLSVSSNQYAGDISVINDGITRGDRATFYSIDGTHKFKKDYYGYRWDKTKKIGMVRYSTGAVEENGGWFETLKVEFLDRHGAWKEVRDLRLVPDLMGGNQPFNKPHFVEYLLVFDPVDSKGIRIIGNAGMADHWYSKKTWFTSITELSVYAPVPDDTPTH